MRVGDRLYYIYKSHARNNYFSYGKCYLINNYITDFHIIFKYEIIDDIGREWAFDSNREKPNYIWKFFITEKEYRRLKLEKINESR